MQATKCPRHSSALSFTWRDSTFQKSRSRVFLWKRCGRCGLLINVGGKKLCFEHLRACKVQPAENEVASVTYPSPHFGPNLEDRYHLLELSAGLLRNWPPNGFHLQPLQPQALLNWCTFRTDCPTPVPKRVNIGANCTKCLPVTHAGKPKLAVRGDVSKKSLMAANSPKSRHVSVCM